MLAASSWSYKDEGSLSVWKRQPGQLNYSILTIHKLVPPPSRISNNATVNILCLAASLWLRCNTDPSHSTVVNPLQHTTTSFAPLPVASSGKGGAALQSPAQEGSTAQPKGTAGGSKGEEQASKRSEQQQGSGSGSAVGASSRSEPQPSNTAEDVSDATATLSVKTEQRPSASASSLTRLDDSVDQKKDQESLLVMTVSDDGHVWQWDIPLHGFLPPPKNPTQGPSTAAPAKGPTSGPSAAPTPPSPALLGLLHTLPHSVTTFSVCPVPVGVGWAGDLSQPSSQSGEGGDAVAVLAAVTSAGNVELITLQRGALTPLSSAISVSLGTPMPSRTYTCIQLDSSLWMPTRASGKTSEHCFCQLC
ncbi:hypothetical protein MMC08_006310 [Hypocenomyce scalaris]|nr:hypothetical protein [Hypocenomyce scalaris]